MSSLIASNNRSIKKQKKPSNNKYRTLRKKVDNLSRNTDSSKQDLNITIDYIEEDINIIYRYIDADEIEILIKKQQNDTNCVVMLYNITEQLVYLDSLLDNVSAKDKCRINGSGGTYYLDLIFIVIKILLNNKTINFNPSVIKLIDLAEKIFPFSDGDKLSLSSYKLLTEGRTFYEGYGFINYHLHSLKKIDYKIDYQKFEELIKLRKYILESPINLLTEYITANYKITSGKKLLYKLPEITDRLQNLIDKLTLLDIDTSSSLTFIFNDLESKLSDNTIDKEEQIKFQNLCKLFVSFIADEMPNILKGILGCKFIEFNSYIIAPSNMNDYYDKILSIYAKYNISIYEDYFRYISILPDDK